jgi:hypothetical protein
MVYMIGEEDRLRLVYLNLDEIELLSKLRKSKYQNQ